jgi:predicted MPP superfamily phosphohydrolase
VAIEPLMRPRITSYRLTPRGWPNNFPLRIAVISDLHACRPWMPPERVQDIVARTNALGADLIVLLGDHMNMGRFAFEPTALDEVAALLETLRAPLGVHAINGNHEWWDDKEALRRRHGPPAGPRALEAVGIPVYDNDAVRLTKDGRPFWLAGLDSQVAFVPLRHAPNPPPREGVDDLAGTLAKVTDDAPVILLAHEPDIIMQVPERVCLTLSGHTHGGQVRLFGWSPVVPSHYGNRFAYGHVREPRDLIVSGGLGCSILPVRFGMPPEIVLVRLGGDAAG